MTTNLSCSKQCQQEKGRYVEILLASSLKNGDKLVQTEITVPN